MQFVLVHMASTADLPESVMLALVECINSGRAADSRSPGWDVNAFPKIPKESVIFALSYKKAFDTDTFPTPNTLQVTGVDPSKVSTDLKVGEIMAQGSAQVTVTRDPSAQIILIMSSDKSSKIVTAPSINVPAAPPIQPVIDLTVIYETGVTLSRAYDMVERKVSDSQIILNLSAAASSANISNTLRGAPW